MYRYLALLFVVFVLIGLVVGALTNKALNPEEDDGSQIVEVAEEGDSYEGTVTYIESFLYPNDNIHFMLVDARGNDIILLKAKDQKLEVAEGHFVTVYGTVRSTSNTKEKYLLVEKVIIDNALD